MSYTVKFSLCLLAALLIGASTNFIPRKPCPEHSEPERIVIMDTTFKKECEIAMQDRDSAILYLTECKYRLETANEKIKNYSYYISELRKKSEGDSVFSDDFQWMDKYMTERGLKK